MVTMVVAKGFFIHIILKYDRIKDKKKYDFLYIYIIFLCFTHLYLIIDLSGSDKSSCTNGVLRSSSVDVEDCFGLFWYPKIERILLFKKTFVMKILINIGEQLF